MLNIIASAYTHPGLKRDLNEDRVWAEVYNPSEGEAVGLFVVCDGMGGHLGGEVASHWATETIKRSLAEYFCPKDPRQTVKIDEASSPPVQTNESITRKSEVTKLESDIRNAVQEANSVVYEYARQKPLEAGDAGTTVTMAFMKGYRTIIANVGDSRTYILRDKQLRQVTNDHSLVSSMVANGQIKPSEIYTHPQRNVIYRSLGQKQQVQIDTFMEIMRPDDYLLLCSDGLWEMVQNDQKIVEIIARAKDPAEACQKLVQEANNAGGEDNIGVVVIHIKA